MLIPNWNILRWGAPAWEWLSVALLSGGLLGVQGDTSILRAQVSGEPTSDSVATVPYRVPLSGKTPKEAERIAVKRAKAEAVRRVVGTTVQAQRRRTTMEGDGNIVNRFSQIVRTDATGRVVESRMLASEIVQRQGEPFYRVRIRATVAASTGSRDPGFRVEEFSLTQDDRVFIAREQRTTSDEIIANIEVTEDAYLTLFNITPDSLQVIWPNSEMTDTHVPADTSIQFPPPNLRRRGLHMRAWPVPDGKEEVPWRLFVVATKEKIPFPTDSPEYKGGGTIAIPNAEILALNRWLVRIPLGQRATATIPYTVKRSTSQ